MAAVNRIVPFLLVHMADEFEMVVDYDTQKCPKWDENEGNTGHIK